MKKVFGLMILAGLPVACGTTLPSTPEATQPAGQDASLTVAASGGAESIRRRVPVPVPQPACAPVDTHNMVDGIKVVVVDRGKGWVRLGTKVLFNPEITDFLPGTCFVITWSAGPDSGRHTLTPSNDTQEVTLTSVPGLQFTIWSSIQSSRGQILARTPIVVE